MPAITLRLGFLFMIALCAACEKPMTPQEVASRFWIAIERGDARDVKKYVTAADAIALDSLDDVLPISDAVLERTVIEKSTAYIDTIVTVEGDKPLNFPLKTYLLLEDEQWKVDYQRTIDAVTDASNLASVIHKFQEFGNALQQGIDQSVRELERSLPQIEQELSRIEGQIKQHVPELRERLENFARELERALKQPPENGDEPAPGDSVEI